MSIAKGFALAGLLLLLLDAYIIFGVVGSSWWVKSLLILPTVVYLFSILQAFCNGEITQGKINRVFWLSLCVFFPTFIFTIVSLVGKLVGLAAPNMPFIFNWIGVVLAAVWLLVALYGIVFGWKKVTVKKINLCFPKLPKKFDGYKIVHLSDFHIGTYLSSPKTVAGIVSKVNTLNPDLIVFTGDLVNNSPAEITPFLSELSKLKAKDGVVSVLGNHDYCLYRKYTPPNTPAIATQKVIELERYAGWHVLLNQSFEIWRADERIAIIGVENAGGKAFTDRSDLQRAMRGVPPNEFKILLSHDPSHWRREVLKSSDIDLTLSGHTHAMQFRIGNFSPSKWAYREWGGVYKQDDRVLVVSTGTGGNVAFRFGAYPRILEINLRN